MINKAVESDGSDSGHPMDFLLTEELNLPTVGETREGWVIEHRNNEILVDIGAKSEGVITGSELQSMDPDTRESLAIGNQVLVYVVKTEDKHGNIVVSYTKAAEQRDWIYAENLLKSQKVYECKVLGHNRGGLIVKVRSLRGFIPNSQMSRNRKLSVHKDSEQNLKKEVAGTVIGAKVIEVERQRNRLILSEKAAEKELRAAKRAALLAELREGDEFEGRVINVADFGAFIDIGHIEGLVHLSELSWKRINHPSEVLKVGNHVKVMVIGIDRERERLALSIKRLEPDPWTKINERYQVGQLFEAMITKLTHYGAFARIQDEYELEGLIHISELSEDHVKHPSEVVKPSQTVTIRIIRVDSEQRQLGLSIKQVVSDKFVEVDLDMLTTIQE